jgi:hypothetical protein
LSELLGILLSATDIADSLLIVDTFPLITDVVIVYFLIVMVRLIVVCVGIASILLRAYAISRLSGIRFGWISMA